MQSKEIPDNAITASSSYDDSTVGPKNARFVDQFTSCLPCLLNIDLESKEIADSTMTASSSYDDSTVRPKNTRFFKNIFFSSLYLVMV